MNMIPNSLVRICTRTCQSGGRAEDNQENCKHQEDDTDQEYEDLVRSLASKYANLLRTAEGFKKRLGTV